MITMLFAHIILTSAAAAAIVLAVTIVHRFTMKRLLMIDIVLK